LWDLISTTKAPLIICAFDFDTSPYPNKVFLKTTDPRLTFLRLVDNLFTPKLQWGIHPTAVIHPEAIIHPNTFIDAFVRIGKCTIGEGTAIYGHCYLYDGVTIGKNVWIHAGTVIGADGFGYQRNEFGELEKFPHIGGVVIEDNVEIGANTCIDRGGLGNTIIREGSKIDNLVHIAHNVEVGKHSLVIASAMVGGSTKIGERAWIAPCAALLNGITVGNDSTIGMGAVVTKNVPDNEVWAGVPAKPIEKK
jgi:UDP-3-O-[3-hydroxymyristoyl] glucosamine N-acyltransferase